MAITPPLHHVPPFLLTLLFAIHLLPFSSSTTATSSATIGFAVDLVHVDAHLNLTYEEHVHRGIHRAYHRAAHLLHHLQRGPHRRNSSPHGHHDASFKTTLEARAGEYLMRLSIGTPPVSFSAIIDTGSALVWTECYHSNKRQHRPIFDPQSSSSYSKVPCSHPFCSALLSGCNGTDCMYINGYADQSNTIGTLSWETFTLGSMKVKNIGFGCSILSPGFQGNNAALVGLSRGHLSLISQLGALVDNKFTYCLSGFDASKPSRLAFGPTSHLIRSKASIRAPMVANAASPENYYVALQGISVGGKRLPIPNSAFQCNPDGTGGVVVDSGSTLMGLVQEAYSRVKTVFIKEIGRSVVNSTNLAMDVCFQGLLNSISIPSLTLHFEGGDLHLPVDNYFVVDSKEQLSCLAILPSPAPVNIIGAITQQSIHVQFDLGRDMITFTPAQCDKL